LVETWIGVFNDVQSTLIPVIFEEDWKNQLEGTWNKIKDKLALLEKNVAGDTALGYLTIVDLRLAPILLLLFKIYPEH
jgi:hypothetical protein